MTGHLAALKNAAASPRPERKIKSTMALADQITALTELINNAPENSRRD